MQLHFEGLGREVGGSQVGAGETFTGCLSALTVINLQIHRRPEQERHNIPSYSRTQTASEFTASASLHVPYNLLLQLPLAESLGVGGVQVVLFGAVIRIDHGLLLIVELEAQVGVKQHAQ